MIIYGVCWDGDDRMWESHYFATIEGAYEFAFGEWDDECFGEKPTLEYVRAEVERWRDFAEFKGCTYIGKIHVKED